MTITEETEMAISGNFILIKHSILTRCRYFQVERILLNSEASEVSYRTDSSSFEVLICVQGQGVLKGKKLRIPFRKGDTIFVPADSEALSFSGKAELLGVNC